MSWRLAVFTIVLAAEAFLLTALLISIRRPRRRIWPPPAQRSWQFLSIWIATAVAFLGSVALAFLDHGSFLFDHVAWRWIGGALIVLGTALVAGWTAGTRGGVRRATLWTALLVGAFLPVAAWLSVVAARLGSVSAVADEVLRQATGAEGAHVKRGVAWVAYYLGMVPKWAMPWTPARSTG